MNRRSFFKVVTGFVAGIFASTAKSKEDFPIPADPLKDKFVLNHIGNKTIWVSNPTGYDCFYEMYRNAQNETLTTYERGINTPPGTLWTAK